MKSITFYLACFLATMVCNAQTKIVLMPNASIDLVIKNSPLQTLIIRNSDQNNKYNIIDSAILGKNGPADNLHFDVAVSGTETHLHLIFSKKNFGKFIPALAPGEHLKIVVDLNNPNELVFTGSAHTQELNDFLKQSFNIGKDFAKYQIAINNHSPDSLVLKNKIDSINHLQSMFLRKVIFNTKSAYVTVLALIYSQNGVLTYTQEELNTLRETFKHDNPVLMQIAVNENLQEHPLNIRLKPANGTYLADFTLPDMQGKPVSLNQFKGKYILVDFWASWCGPCRKESPYLKKAVQQFGKDNFVVLEVSIDEIQSDWKKAIITDGTQAFIHVIDTRGVKSPVKARYNIDSIPSNFLLDPTGKVIDQDLRGQKLITRVAEVIENSSARK